MASLREELDIELCGKEVTLKINFHLIEIVEKVYGAIADVAVSDTLVNKPRRHEIAKVMSEWAHSDKLSKSEIYKDVMTSNQDRLMSYIGAIQGVVLYSLNYIDDKSLDRLTEGKDLEDEPEINNSEADTSGNPT